MEKYMRSKFPPATSFDKSTKKPYRFSQNPKTYISNKVLPHFYVGISFSNLQTIHDLGICQKLLNWVEVPVLTAPPKKNNIPFQNWAFPTIGVPQNGWFTMENLIKIDDLEVPLFLETPISELEGILKSPPWKKQNKW